MGCCKKTNKSWNWLKTIYKVDTYRDIDFNFQLSYWLFEKMSYHHSKFQQKWNSTKQGEHQNEIFERMTRTHDDIILSNWTIVISITTMDLGKYQNIKLPWLFVFYLQLVGVLQNKFSPHKYIVYFIRNILDENDLI